MSLNLELKRAREAKQAGKKDKGPPKEVVVTIFKSIQEETAWRIEQMMAHPVKPPPSPSSSCPHDLPLTQHSHFAGPVLYCVHTVYLAPYGVSAKREDYRHGVGVSS